MIDSNNQNQNQITSAAAKDNFILKATNSLIEPFKKLKNKIHSIHEAHTAGLLTPIEMSQRLNMAEALCNKIYELIRELSDLSITETGCQLEVHLEDSNLVNIAADVLENLIDLAIEKGCCLRFHAPELVIGEWDVLRLQQLLSQLILNAIHHACGSEIDVKITSSEHYAQIEVKDSGPGIAISMQSKIFERFTKVDENSESFGTGLWLVKEIVDRFDGTITLESSPENGSVFLIELPLKNMLH